MKIQLEFIPLKITISNKDGYNISLLIFNNNSIGFNFHNIKKQDCIEKRLNVYFYKYCKNFLLKTIKYKEYYKCNYCGNVVWKHNNYCDKCKDDLLDCEITIMKNYE